MNEQSVDIQEIYGSHYELPELGPLGSHGLANARDFESPVSSFDIDQSPWEIVYKCAARLMGVKGCRNTDTFQGLRATARCKARTHTLRRRRLAWKVSILFNVRR